LTEKSEPFSLQLGGVTGISRYEVRAEHRLSDLSGYFQDRKFVRQMLSKDEDPKIYEVYEFPQPAVEGLLNVGCTIVYPGKIGKEYYFTKGHFHQKESTSEVYIGLEGEGLILIQNRKGEVAHMTIKPGLLVQIPPNSAHRSINTGSERLVFLAVYPSDSGHDYESIERTGFAKIVVERNDRPVVEENPKYLKSLL